MSIYDSIYLGERLIVFISPHPFFVFKIASSQTNERCGAEHNGERRFVIFTVLVFLSLSLSSL